MGDLFAHFFDLLAEIKFPECLVSDRLWPKAAPHLRRWPLKFQAFVSASLTIVITPNGHLRSHLRQPVQACASCSTECLPQPSAFRLNTCGGQAATHQPQPVQCGTSTRGSHMVSEDTGGGMARL